MRPAPSQMTATLDPFSTIITIGNIQACRRPARRAVSVRRSFATSNRARSTGSRTKARTTRMPVICSRSTWLTRSIRSCMRRNCGTIRETTSPTPPTSSGMLTVSTHDRPTSSRSAMTMPPTEVIGAAMKSVQVISTNIWTWVTSLVIRVMSDGAPNSLTSRAE